MTVKDAIKNKEAFKNLPKYEYLPPEGGWGYAVVAATAVMFVSTYWLFTKDFIFLSNTANVTDNLVQDGSMSTTNNKRTTDW